MEEDDDIDILGDFNLDSFLSKSDSALYENTSLVSQNSDLLKCDYTIHPQWLLDRPSTNPDCWYDPTLNLQTEVDTVAQASAENSITDESGWTDKEKSLLERGIEIFGKSHVRLAQFIGSKTPAEIKYYLKNFYSEAQTNYGGFSAGINDISVSNIVCDILDETQIPASIEEVIATVGTTKPVALGNKRRKTISCNSYEELDNNKESVPKSYDAKKKKKARKNVKFKIKTRLKFPMGDIKQKTIKVMNETKKIEITTGNGLSVPICEGEEIVKIVKEDSDSDLEIDIEDEPVEKSVVVQKETADTVKTKEVAKNYPKPSMPLIDLSILGDFLVKQLTSMETPTCELRINANFISELEKLISAEFFEGRSTKTPLRYLKIRNYIIDTWISVKPLYVKKTSIRQGLKNCGDVNCISRIHSYLEQVGAINFGCRQTHYERPLINLFGTVQGKEKDTKLRSNTEIVSPRQRTKRKVLNEGEGGRTLTHNEHGEVINTTIVSEDSPPKVKRPPIKPIRLIYCRPFGEGHTEKFKVRMSLTTLLLLDFHAHTSLTEVMGLVGGTWNVRDRILSINHYEPCRNLASSSTHCDMCPVSQSKSAERIQNAGLKVLGWFHSHPTFAPEPSQQDLDTQQSVQQWMGNKVPCLGVILSPFSAHGALIASPFRCLIVENSGNDQEQSLPYKFNVSVASEGCNFERFYKDLRRVHIGKSGQLHRVNFKEPYFHDVAMNYLEKYITSVRMHLANCGTLNKTTCDYIVQRIVEICKD